MIGTGYHGLLIETVRITSANNRYRPAPSVAFARRNGRYLRAEANQVPEPDAEHAGMASKVTIGSPTDAASRAAPRTACSKRESWRTNSGG